MAVSDEDLAGAQLGQDAGMAASDERQAQAREVLNGSQPQDGGNVTAGGRQ